MNRIIYFLALLIFPLFNHPAFTKHLEATLEKHGKEDAAPLYQDMGQEAQKLVDITYPYPIKKMAPHSSFYTTSLGCCSHGIIFIKEVENPVNARLTIIHELFHLKQFNGKFFEVIDKDQYRHFEEEANLEAAILGNCWYCSAHSALAAYSVHNTSSAACVSRVQGYPSCEAYHKIVLQQFKKGCCCTYHQDQPLSYKMALLTLLHRKSRPSD